MLKNTLNIQSIEELAEKLDESPEYFKSISKRIPKLYYSPTKRKKPKGGVRKTNEPINKLKSLQSKILRNILESVPLNSCIHGYRKNHSPLTNAKPHVGKKFLLKLDIKDFFPSIHYKRVEKLFSDLGCSLEVSRMLTQLTTFQHYLPQGAPTSPYISNLIPANVDKQLQKICRRNNLPPHKRYGDDITISGNKNFSKLIPEIENTIKQNGFKISKKEFLTPKDRKVVTGLIVNTKVNVPKEKVRKVCAIIHNCIKYGPDSQNREGKPNFKDSLRGHVEYIRSINPPLGDKLMQEFNKIEWNSPEKITISSVSIENNEVVEIFVDGATSPNPGPSAIGWIAFRKENKLEEYFEYIGCTTNNIAEYTAVIRALEAAQSKWPQEKIIIRSDSELVVNQVNGSWNINQQYLADLCKQVKKSGKDTEWQLLWVSRKENLAHKLSMRGLYEEKIKARASGLAVRKSSPGIYKVESASGHGMYDVTLAPDSCTCLFFQKRKCVCKHIFAARIAGKADN
ncbi:reverse transcriptase-like protein [bacterium]|nr:reverse transcriptase-like protein [bacterium]